MTQAEITLGPKSRDALLLYFSEAQRRYPGRDIDVRVNKDGIGLAVGSLVLTLEASND